MEDSLQGAEALFMVGRHEEALVTCTEELEELRREMQALQAAEEEEAATSPSKGKGKQRAVDVEEEHLKYSSRSSPLISIYLQCLYEVDRMSELHSFLDTYADGLLNAPFDIFFLAVNLMITSDMKVDKVLLDKERHYRDVESGKVAPDASDVSMQTSSQYFEVIELYLTYCLLPYDRFTEAIAFVNDSIRRNYLPAATRESLLALVQDAQLENLDSLSDSSSRSRRLGGSSGRSSPPSNSPEKAPVRSPLPDVNPKPKPGPKGVLDVVPIPFSHTSVLSHS